jgi:hypothetical protein
LVGLLAVGIKEFAKPTVVAAGRSATDRYAVKSNPLVTNETFPIDYNTMGMSLVPSLYCHPPVSAVTIVFIVITVVAVAVVAVAIVVNRIAAIEWGSKPNGDIIMVSVVSMHRFGGRSHGHGASSDCYGGHQ